MSVLYSNNFDSTTAGTLPSGWTQAAGQNMVAHATEAITSPNSFGIATATTGSKSGTAYLTGISRTSMCVYFEFYMHDSGAANSHTAVYQPTIELCQSGTSYYSFALAPKTTASNSFISLQKVVSGVTSSTWNNGGGGVAGSTYGTGYPDGSIICVKFEVTSDTNPIVHAKWWTKGTTEPGWLVTATDTSGVTLTGTCQIIMGQALTTILTPLASLDNFYLTTSASDIPLVAQNISTTSVQGTEVDLTWTAPTTGASPYTYDVLRSPNPDMSSATTLVSGQSGTTYADTTVSPVTTYYYQVTVHDNVETALSNILTVTTPTNNPATSYSITMPSPASGPNHFASQTISIQLNGTIANGATVNIIGTDDQGATTTTYSVTGTGNVPSAGNVTYTPTVAGSRTLTWSHTGTATGITDPSTNSYTAIPTIIANTTGYKESPGNWVGATSRTDTNQYRQTWNPGAYLFFEWTDTSSSPAATIFCDYMTQGSGNTLTYWADGSLYSNVAIPAPQSSPLQSSISIQGLIPQANFTHKLIVCLNSSNSQTNRWTFTNGLKFYGLELATTCTPVSIPASNGWVLFWGDSITEALPASVNAGNAGGYAGLITQMLLQNNYDVCISACSGNGWLITGGIGDVPALYNVTSGGYQESSSRWDKIGKIGSTNISFLDSNNQLSAYGATNQNPKIIFVNMGTNEQLHNGNVTYTQTAVQLAMSSWRTAAPNSNIICQIPFGLYNNTVFSANSLGAVGTDYVTAIKNSFNAATPNTKTTMSDFGTWMSWLIPSATTTNDSGKVHPNDEGHAIIAPNVYNQLSPVINNTGGGGTTVTKYQTLFVRR